jgi:hypothetical protein
MKYITSASDQEYSIEGLLIPKRRYSQFELNNGKSSTLAVSDAEYEKLAGNGYFQRGVKRGLFTVSDAAPLDKLSDGEKAKVYEDKLAKKDAEIAAFRKERDRLSGELAALRAREAGGVPSMELNAVGARKGKGKK